MKISLTSGAVYDIPDMCACCAMSTGGEHESRCPLYRPIIIEKYMPKINVTVKYNENLP